MLSAFQKKIAAVALTCLSFTIIALFIVALFTLFAELLGTFGTVIWPLATACILTFILKPVVTFLSSKTKLSAGLSTLFVFVITIILALLAIILIVPFIAEQLKGVIAEIPNIVDKFMIFIGEKFPDLKQQIQEKADLNNLSKETMGLVVAWVLKVLRATLSATNSAAHFLAYLSAFAVAPIYLYYMLSTNYDTFGAINRNISFIPEKWRNDIVFLVRQFVMIMVAFFRGQLLIAFIMGVLLGIGFLISGIKFGFLIGFTAGILNVVPYFGTMIGLSIALPTAFFQDGGGIILVAVAMSIFIAVQLLEGYFLTPRIMGSNTGLHPTVIIFSVFFWGIALNGILGMILAIPLSAFIVVFWRLLLTKYLSKKTE